MPDASFDVATSRRIEYAVGVFHRERRLMLHRAVHVCIHADVVGFPVAEPSMHAAVLVLFSTCFYAAWKPSTLFS
jgi:hypothetical protein